jgi:hypothetical protein
VVAGLGRDLFCFNLEDWTGEDSAAWRVCDTKRQLILCIALFLSGTLCAADILATALHQVTPQFATLSVILSLTTHNKLD